MAMRRPRLKAAINLAPRRAATAAPSAKVPESDPVKEAPDVKPVSTMDLEVVQAPEQLPDTSVVQETPQPLDGHPIETSAVPDPIPEAQNPSTNDLLVPMEKPSTRRIIKPPVCLPIRKRKPLLNAAEQTTEVIIKPEPTPVSIISVNVRVDDSKPEPMDTTPAEPEPPQFKPPFLSPSMQTKQEVFYHHMLGNAPTTDENCNSDHADNSLVPLQSPNKVRQRIRPTPCFALHRRNSMNQGGNDSESDAEPSKRQRLISSSSTHSAMVGQSPVVRGSAIPNRMRTESVCSNVSDIMAMRDLSSKPKKAARSEEFQRIVQAKRDFSTRFQGNKPDKARLTMFDMIFYNPSTNPMKNPAVKSRRPSTSSSTSAQSIKGRRSSTTSSVVSAVSKMSSIGSSSIKSAIKIEKREEEETMMPVPQLKLGPNGEIILDEKSLVIETTGDKEARETLANADIVYDDEFSGTSGFYKRSKRTRDWPPDETIRFYRCLHTIGTDFSLMLSLFPNRTRRDMKLKFKKEERNNPSLINKALLYPKQFDIDELKKDFAREEEEMEKVRAKWEEDKKIQAEAKKNVLKETGRKNRMSNAMRVISAGDDIYQLAESNLGKRKRNRKPKQEAIETDAHVIVPDFPPAYTLPNQRPPSTNPDTKHLNEWISTIPPNEPLYNNDLDSRHQLNPETIEELPSDHRPIDDDGIPVSCKNDLFIESIEDLPSDHRPIDVDDIPLSCKDDLFSDQFVDEAIQMPIKLNEEDILNMEIIFDSVSDFEEPMSKDDSLISDNFQIASIHSITDGSQYSSINNTIYLNPTKDLNSADTSIVANSNEFDQPTKIGSCVNSELSTESNSHHAQGDVYEEDHTHSSKNSIVINKPDLITDIDFKQDLKASTESAHNQNESANQAERDPDIEQPEDFYCGSSQSHMSPFSSRQSEKSPANEEKLPNCQFNKLKTEKEPSFGEKTPDTELPLTGFQDGQDEVVDEEEDDDEDLSSLADSLVVVSRKDAEGNIVHEVFLMSPTTGCLSDEPLDLPAEVIERIKMSLMT